MPNLVGIWSPDLSQEAVSAVLNTQLRRVRVRSEDFKEQRAVFSGFGMALQALISDRYGARLLVILALGFALPSWSANAEVLRVGPDRELARPSDAARVARDGDIVEIDAGLYENDAAIWRQNGLTIRGVGGMAHLRAKGAQAEGKGIWVIKGANTLIQHIEFSGAEVHDLNGAGLRAEGAGLTVSHCYFHHNQGGILAGTNLQSDIVIEHSEFAYQEVVGRYSHNLYIGNVRSFTLRFSYVHHAVVGHNVKSRARRNEISYNRIMDEMDGRSSYAIDLPEGGLSYVIGNVIQQGPLTENDAVLAYGAEGLTHAINELYFVNNTVVNDLPAGGRFIFARGGKVLAVNNILSGAGALATGAAIMHFTNNLLIARSDFQAPNAFDYRLKKGSVAIGAAIDPGRAHGVDLRPAAEYVHKARRRDRHEPGLLDMGALQFLR